MRASGTSRRFASSAIAALSAGGAGQDVAALILAEEERVLEAVRLDVSADSARHRHLGQRDRKAAVREVMHGADPARPDEGEDEFAIAALGGKVDRRRRALLAGQRPS